MPNLTTQDFPGENKINRQLLLLRLKIVVFRALLLVTQRPTTRDYPASHVTLIYLRRRKYPCVDDKAYLPGREGLKDPDNASASRPIFPKPGGVLERGPDQKDGRPGLRPTRPG